MPEKIADKSALSGLFAALQTAVFERAASGAFRMLARPPQWLAQFALNPKEPEHIRPQDYFPFLDNFLLDAEDFWGKQLEGVLRSGPWVQQRGDDQEIPLEAMAVRLADRKILLVQQLEQNYLERRDLLQKARENSLNYHRLLKEIQTKEVLLHCIVHDLAGPLTGVKGLLGLLGREDLSEAGRRRLKIGNEAADKLESQISEILDVFSAEIESLQSFSVSPAEAPDLGACIRTVLDTLQPAATLKNIELRLESKLDLEKHLKVAGETTRLERVLFNLLENAFRHSPSGGAVWVTVESGDDAVSVWVCDNGPGIPSEMTDNLFQKFHQRGGRTGKAGLGLYFCRIVVERWGGEIGYSRRPEGGSNFWFKLPRVDAGSSSPSGKE